MKWPLGGYIMVNYWLIFSNEWIWTQVLLSRSTIASTLWDWRGKRQPGSQSSRSCLAPVCQEWVSQTFESEHSYGADRECGCHYGSKIRKQNKAGEKIRQKTEGRQSVRARRTTGERAVWLNIYWPSIYQELSFQCWVRNCHVFQLFS